MDLREMGSDQGNWIALAEDRDQWRAYLRVVMKLRVSEWNEILFSLHIEWDKTGISRYLLSSTFAKMPLCATVPSDRKASLP